VAATSGRALTARGKQNIVRQFLASAGFYNTRMEDDAVLGRSIVGVPGWRILTTSVSGVNAGERLLRMVRGGKASPWRVAVVRATTGMSAAHAGQEYLEDGSKLMEVGDFVVMMRLEDFAYFLQSGIKKEDRA
jgi:hypothetical protein